MGRLYAVEPVEFMAERKRLAAEAKAAGDAAACAEIGKLRKPSLAGWAVNLVARQAPRDVATLLDVGEKLRRAQSQLDMATLQALRPDRDAAVDGFVEAAVRVLADRGRELRGAVQQEVRDTAIAAIADAGAATVAASGQMVKALSYSGFGEVDVSDAVARTSSGAILTVLDGSAADVEQAAPDEDAEPARDAKPAKPAKRSKPSAQDAERVAAERAQRIAAAETAVEEAERAVDTAEAGLTEARRTLKAAQRAEEAALKELTAARRA